MNSISSYSPSLSASPGFQEAYQSYSELQAARLSVSESQSKDITIFTDEGDRVTISSNQQCQTQHLTYEGLARKRFSGEYQGHAITKESLAMVKGERFESENSGSISISVEGDLNEQELKDIKRALKKIDKIMTDFLHRGDMVDAAVKSMEIGKLDTIASLEANYRYEKSAIFEQTSLKEKTTYSRGSNPETPPLAKIENPLNHVKSLIEELTNIIKESQIEPSRFKKSIQKLFSDYKNNPTENEPRDNHRIRMTEWIETELLKKLSSLSAKIKMVSQPSPEE